MSNNLTINHNPEQNRFEARTEAGMAVLVYMKVGDTLIFHHTEVPQALEGQGLASQLAHFGLEYVREKNISAAALCPFVQAYVRKNPEYQSLLKIKA